VGMPFVSGARGYGGRAACSLLAGAYAPGGDVVVQAGLSLYPFPADFATVAAGRGRYTKCRCGIACALPGAAQGFRPTPRPGQAGQ
jgi:hypothetical protein